MFRISGLHSYSQVDFWIIKYEVFYVAEQLNNQISPMFIYNSQLL